MKPNKHLFGVRGRDKTEAVLSALFFDLVKVEPRLLTLAKDIDDEMRARPIDFFKDSQRWYGPKGFKRRMCRLAGFDADVRSVSDSRSYDTAYDFLWYYLIEERGFRKHTLEELEGFFHKVEPNPSPKACGASTGCSGASTGHREAA